jgi:molybdenum cofactor cytidylyltransferase
MSTAEPHRAAAITGILLAGGRGTRFDPSGRRDKLRQALPGGEAVAVAAARNMLAVLPTVIAVVRHDNQELALALRQAGCTVSPCNDSGQGMAASLVHGLKQAKDAAGWIIALADMPYVAGTTISALRDALADGAGIAAPVWNGKRGNPVGFGRRHLDALLQLRGDEGARSLLKSCPVAEVPVNDSGIRRDIDTPDDLPAACGADAGERQ